MFSWFRHYITFPFDSIEKESQKQEVSVERDGVNIILAENNEQGAKILNKLLVNLYSHSERQESKVYTDFPSNFEEYKTTTLDIENVDNLLLKRKNKPESVTYVIFDTIADMSFYESECFKSFVRDLDTLNLAIYIIIPVRHARQDLLKNANRVFLSKLRKIPLTERFKLYQVLSTKEQTYTKFIEFWLSCSRNRKLMLIEEQQWKEFNLMQPET